MVVSLSVVGIALLALILAVAFLPLAPERRHVGRTALTSAFIVTAGGVVVMTALFLAFAASKVPLLVSASTIPLMAAFAMAPIGGLVAVVFGTLGLGWPTLFDRPNDRFAANLYAMIAAAILVICVAGGKKLHDDWPGYLVALLTIPLVPLLTKKRLGPLLTRGLAIDPEPRRKGEWARPVIVQRKLEQAAEEKAVATPSSSGKPRLASRIFAARFFKRRPPVAPEPSQAPTKARSPATPAVTASGVVATKTSQQKLPAVREPPRKAVAAPGKMTAKADITAIAVAPVAARVPVAVSKQSPVQRRPGKSVAVARQAVPQKAGTKKPAATLIIPEDQGGKAPAAEVVAIRPRPRIEQIEDVPEPPPVWTNLVVGNITLEDGRSYSVAIRSTQTIGENDIRKLAKAG